MPLRVMSSSPTSWTSDFRAALDKQFDALQLQRPTLLADVSAQVAPPELLLFFGNDPWVADAAVEDALRTYAGDVETLLPIVERAACATTHLPAAVRDFNAFFTTWFASRWPEALVDEVLALTWQRRRTRKLFISYLRSQSATIAQQLYTRYSQRGFEVFLDDFEIQRGARFQEELGRRLDDADAVVLLWSPDLDQSPWVRHEINLATTCRVGLIGLIWPESAFPPAPADAKRPYEQVPVDCRHQFGASVDLSNELDDGSLEKVDELVFTRRSMAIASRVRDLISEARLLLDGEFTIGAHPAPDTLELVAKQDGSAWRARILPFRPELRDVYEVWQEMASLSPPVLGAVILYPEVDPRDPRTRALSTVVNEWGTSATPKLRIHCVRV